MTLMDKFIDFAIEQVQQSDKQEIMNEIPNAKHVLISGNELYYLNFIGDVLFQISLEAFDEVGTLLN